MRRDLTDLDSAIRRFARVLLQRGRVQLDADDDQYTRLRRLLVFVEESVKGALRWAAFEPDDNRWRRRVVRRRRRRR